MSLTAAYRIEGALVVETFTDHLGQQYSQTYMKPAAWGVAEIEARLEAARVDLEVRLADGEAEQVVG